MDLTQLKISKEEVIIESSSKKFPTAIESTTTKETEENIVSLEAEIPEALYMGMKEFISSNPEWDQYRLMSSALASFLFQNGSEDRAVTEKYLNDLFALTNS